MEKLVKRLFFKKPLVHEISHKDDAWNTRVAEYILDCHDLISDRIEVEKARRSRNGKPYVISGHLPICDGQLMGAALAKFAIGEGTRQEGSTAVEYDTSYRGPGGEIIYLQCTKDVVLFSSERLHTNVK